MAFKDITKFLYPNEFGEPTIKLDYKDKAHRYYAYPRLFNEDGTPVEADLSKKKAWGKVIYPKGTTTLIGDTLEKNGLLTWPMGMALQELFGFYNFKTTGSDGKEIRLKGFSKVKAVGEDGKVIETGELMGTMWVHGKDHAPVTNPLEAEELLPIVISASENHNRKKKKGADIGSVVHDAIEHFIKLQPFDIAEQYMWSIKDNDYEYEADRVEALENFEEDVRCATLAFEQFVNWWTTTSPVLYGAEDLLYSLVHNVCGTYDGDIGIQAKHHPVFHNLGEDIIRVTADWKTSKASTSELAAMPEGISYSYFIQSAIYEIIRREMGFPAADDLLVVSCRKDGGFTLLYASELGFTVGDCIKWAESVIFCYKMMTTAKKGLWAHYEASNAKEVTK